MYRLQIKSALIVGVEPIFLWMMARLRNVTEKARTLVVPSMDTADQETVIANVWVAQITPQELRKVHKF